MENVKGRGSGFRSLQVSGVEISIIPASEVNALLRQSSPHLKTIFKQIAAQHGMPLSSYINIVLARHLRVMATERYEVAGEYQDARLAAKQR